jgi:two-component system response regulator YesN
MYKLVIVDDEPTVRHGLRSYFDWDAYGIEIVDEADDGDVALEVIERVQPDFVITDVRMPHIDGIQLANLLSERFPHIKLAFVSGHDDADYLKSALKVKAVDYIFKPVNLQELEAVVRHVVTVLQEEERERKLIGDMQVKLMQSMPLLREKFLMSLIRDGAKHPPRIRERAEFLGLDLPLEAPYWVVTIQLDNRVQVMDNRSERDRQLLSYSVLNIVQELVDRDVGGYAFEHRTGEFVGILRMEDGRDSEEEELLFTLAEEVRESLQRYLKISVTIGVGQRISKLDGLSKSYAQAKEAAEQRWFLGKNRIISMDNLEQEEDSFFRIDQAQSESLVSALKAADAERVRTELDAVYVLLARNRREGMPYGRNVSLQLLLLAGRLLLELNVQREGLAERESELMATVFQQETLAELRELVEGYLLQACERIGEKRSGKSKNVIERVHKLIEQRYAENLQVKDIAEAVFLSVTYLCLLFKQETGETINEYMTKVRVEKAKELLREPGSKFYEVCYAVGYSDPSYFSKIFKKYTGFTPSSYRDYVM